MLQYKLLRIYYSAVPALWSMVILKMELCPSGCFARWCWRAGLLCRFAHPYLAFIMFIPPALIGLLIPRTVWSCFPLSQDASVLKTSKEVGICADILEQLTWSRPAWFFLSFLFLPVFLFHLLLLLFSFFFVFSFSHIPHSYFAILTSN